MKISRLGEAPDYRFSLANERTFLAWIRTSLGFLAAGVGLDQLAPDFATPVIRELLALLLCLFAGGLAIYGYLRWLRNVAVALGNAPWDEANIRALESRRGEHPLLDEHIEWAIAQQIEKRNAGVVEVQLPKKQRLVRVIEKGLPRDV